MFGHQPAVRPSLFSLIKSHNQCRYRYVDIKSSDREPFIKALQKLRPDLKKTVSELDDHLKVLEGDIAELIGRLQHPHIFQELKIKQSNGNS